MSVYVTSRTLQPLVPVDHFGIMRIVTIRTSPISQVSLDQWFRILEDITSISEHPDRLHPHDHMLHMDTELVFYL